MNEDAVIALSFTLALELVLHAMTLFAHSQIGFATCTRCHLCYMNEYDEKCSELKLTTGVSSKYFVLVASFYWPVVHESLPVSEAYCFRTEV